MRGEVGMKEKKKKDEMQVKITLKDNEKKFYDDVKKTVMKVNDTTFTRTNLLLTLAVLPTEILNDLQSRFASDEFYEIIDRLKGRNEVDITLLKLYAAKVRQYIAECELERLGVSSTDLKQLLANKEIEITRQEDLYNTKVKEKVEEIRSYKGKKAKNSLDYDIKKFPKGVTEREVVDFYTYLQEHVGKDVFYRYSPDEKLTEYIVAAKIYKLPVKYTKNNRIIFTPLESQKYELLYQNPITGKCTSIPVDFSTLLYKLVDICGLPYTEYGLRSAFMHYQKGGKTIFCHLASSQFPYKKYIYKTTGNNVTLSNYNVLKYSTDTYDYLRLDSDGRYSNREYIEILQKNHQFKTTVIDKKYSPYEAALHVLFNNIKSNKVKLLKPQTNTLNISIATKYNLNKKLYKDILR